LSVEVTDQPIEQLLHPDSELHKEVVKKLKARIDLSHRHMSQRYDDWDRVDEHCRLYVDLSRKSRKGDKTADTSKKEMPFARSIVIPVSYAILQVRETQLMNIFGARDPIFGYKGRGPEDVKPAKLMEAAVGYDLEQAGGAMTLFQTIQDSEKYGMGPSHDCWERQSGTMYEPIRIPGTQINVKDIPLAAALFRGMGLPTKRKVEGIVKEFNSWKAVDPFMFYPDPRVPISELQRGEFCGHGDFCAKHTLMEDSQDNGGPYFNLEHLATIQKYKAENTGRSRSRFTGDDFRLATGTGSDNGEDFYQRGSLQVRIIPRDWKLGDSDRAEIWWFTLINDTLIIRAHPSVYDHDELGYSVAESNPDTHCMNNQGQIENIDGLQRFINWSFNAHYEAIRKFLNDGLIYGPSWIEEADLLAAGPVKHIRLSKLGEKLVLEGKLTPERAAFQLRVDDVTSKHLEIVDRLFALAQFMTAASDPLTGRQTQDDRTLGEVQQITAAASARIALTAKLIDAQSLSKTARRFAMNRQQFTSMEQWFRITGDLLKENVRVDPMNPTPELQLVHPDDLIGNFDYTAITGATPPDPAKQAELWIKLLEGAGKIPQLHVPGIDGKVLDMRELYNEAARQAGAKNINEFYMAVEQAPTVMDDEQLDREKQKGNVVPFEQGMAA
jgi:hypothetical protein